MKLLKKILRIIAIILPSFVPFLFSHNSYALDYFFTDLPVYEPITYDPNTDSFINSPYSWLGKDISPISQFRVYRELVNDVCVPTVNSTPYIQHIGSTFRINFSAYDFEYDDIPNSCKYLDGEWYDYSSVHIGYYTATGINKEGVIINDQNFDSSFGSFNNYAGTGLNLTKMYETTYGVDSLFINSLNQGFSIPFYYNPEIHGALTYEEPGVDNTAQISFSVASSDTDVYVVQDSHITLNAYFYSTDSNAWVDKVVNCNYLNSQSNRGFDLTCSLGYTSENDDVRFDLGSAVYFQLNFPEHSLYSQDGVIHVYSIVLTPDGSHKYGGTISLTQNGRNVDSAPAGDFEDQSGSFLKLFNFNMLNPVAVIYNLFTARNQCRDIPIIASMIHSEQTRICPFYPSIVYEVVSPVLSLAGIMLCVSYFYKWARDDESVIVSVKGGKS